MRDLDVRIAAWRQQMNAGGIRSQPVLDELESHLRDDVAAQLRSGVPMGKAIEVAVQRLGQPAALELEFQKVGEITETTERMKRAFCALAGIPNHYMNETMNTPFANLEPRWATYVKSAAFLAPALLLWAMSVVFIVPKLEQISADAGGQPLPTVIRVMLGLSHNWIFIAAGVVAVLFLLEWRSKAWARYRRATIGIGTFALNAAVLITIFMMVVAAILVAPALMHRAG